MQNINTEYRKGILFIRLKRRSDYNEVKNTIKYLISNIGVKIIVLNTNNLE